jgi:hypothetical protein
MKLNKGILVELHNQKIMLRTRLHGTILDLTSRASLYCMNGHKGKYGCSWCLNAGKCINRRNCIPVDSEKPDMVTTVENVEQAYDLLKNSKDKTVIDGFKHISVLYFLPYWNIQDIDQPMVEGKFRIIYAFHLKAFIWDKFCQD